MQRLFVAIPLSANEEVLILLNTLRKKLQFEQINWVRPENLHLTLKFLGETSFDKRTEVILLLKKIVEEQNSFSICMNRTGIFGSRYNPRVLWLGSEKKSDQLMQLTQNIIKSFEALGYPSDRQNFVPHLTLARIKRLNDKHFFQKTVQEIQQKTYLQQKVGSIILYESILHKEGPIYKIIESFNLQ